MSKEISRIDPQQPLMVQSPPPTPQYSFDQLVRMAQSFAKSGLFGVKDADSALSLLLIAQAEGRNPALIMRDFDVIEGRPAKKAEAMLRDFQASAAALNGLNYRYQSVREILASFVARIQ